MNHSIFSAVCLMVGFLFCHYLPQSTFIKNNPEVTDGDNTKVVLLRRGLLFFFFGILPFLFLLLSGENISEFGVNFRKPGFTLIAGFIIGLVLISLVLINYRKPANLQSFPQIRKKEWDSRLLFIDTLSWILYLLAYEFFFRGYLLFSMVNDFGKWEAITINIALYSLVHIPAGAKETLGAIPLGFVFCFISLYTGNFWTAFIAHSFMAVSNEWLSLSAHPEIKFVRLK